MARAMQCVRALLTYEINSTLLKTNPQGDIV